jgi:hypothetical protein
MRWWKLPLPGKLCRRALSLLLSLRLESWSLLDRGGWAVHALGVGRVRIRRIGPRGVEPPGHLR